MGKNNAENSDSNSGKKPENPKLSSKEQEVINTLMQMGVNGADDYSSSNANVLIIDNYQNSGSDGITNISSAVEEAGYNADVLRHSDAKKYLTSKKDFSEKYDVVILSGSGKAWTKTNEKYKGRTAVESRDAVHAHLVKTGKPLYGICGGAHGIAEALGYKVLDTGKFNRGKKENPSGEEKDVYNHKYGIPIEHLDEKVKNLVHIEHQDEKYLSSAEIGNIKIVQHHPEKTKHGRKDIADFLNKYVASEDYSQKKAA